MQTQALGSTATRGGFDAWQAGAQAGARIGLDRFRDAPAAAAPAALTPVQRGQAAREADAAAKTPKPIHVSSTVV